MIIFRHMQKYRIVGFYHLIQTSSTIRNKHIKHISLFTHTTINDTLIYCMQLSSTHFSIFIRVNS
jgi:hypothetical protein